MEYYTKEKGMSLATLRKNRDRFANNRLRSEKLGNMERYEYYNKLFEQYKEKIKNFEK